MKEMTMEQRLKGKYYVANNGCWIWTGAFGGSRSPRPQIRVNWKLYYVTRYIWENVKGPIGHLLVCHRCDDNRCVNPDHLFLGTQTENMRDASRRGKFPGKVTINEEVVATIKQLRDRGLTHNEISISTGIPMGTIGHILIGNRWSG